MENDHIGPVITSSSDTLKSSSWVCPLSNFVEGGKKVTTYHTAFGNKQKTADFKKAQAAKERAKREEERRVRDAARAKKRLEIRAKLKQRKEVKIKSPTTPARYVYRL